MTRKKQTAQHSQLPLWEAPRIIMYLYVQHFKPVDSGAKKVCFGDFWDFSLTKTYCKCIVLSLL